MKTWCHEGKALCNYVKILSSDYTETNYMFTMKEDMAGSGHGIIYDTIQASASRDWAKPQKPCQDSTTL